MDIITGRAPPPAGAIEIKTTEMSTKPTATDRRIARVFARHDGDNSGTLDLAELRPALACLGVFISKVSLSLSLSLLLVPAVAIRPM